MIPSLNGRSFVEDDREFSLLEDREGSITGTYSGGSVVAGALVGRRDGRELSFGWTQIERNGVVSTGQCSARLELSGDGLVRVHVSGASGFSLLEERPGPRWLRTRVAHPTASVSAAIAFYGDLLGFPVDGPHDATPHELLFVDLPGGAQLELTAGGEAPLPSTRDDLLVLYVPTAAEVGVLRERLVAGGVGLEVALNPYWERMGVTVRDPDGRLVVVAQLPG